MAVSASKLEKPIVLDRQYREVKPNTWVWKRLNPAFSLSFDEMPDAKTTNFILLVPLGQGGAWDHVAGHLREREGLRHQVSGLQ